MVLVNVVLRLFLTTVVIQLHVTPLPPQPRGLRLFVEDPITTESLPRAAPPLRTSVSHVGDSVIGGGTVGNSDREDLDSHSSRQTDRSDEIHELSDVFNHGRWVNMGTTNNRFLPLVSDLKRIVTASKAVNTRKCYDHGFKQWCSWANSFKVNVLPASEQYVALYLVSIIQSSSSVAKLDQAIYSIGWVHQLAGFPNPCSSDFIKMIRAGGSRLLGCQPCKKEPITPDILKQLVTFFAKDSCSLMDLRIVCMCLVGFAGFLRFAELVNIKRSDIVFADQFMTIRIPRSKTDVVSAGAEVVIAKTSTILCPVAMLKRYLTCAKIPSDSTAFIFRQMSFCKSSNSFQLRNSGPLSYTRARELLLEKLSLLG
ncbi:uncharacterized protein LOC110446587 [Mizuhopecten yessoensis]|uniref:uncharacterized protein LOC110446587 n=1 Tax=Mizuhopecten yessoensis TaxID=6573 RepID=UPI000B45CE01|nr:uncharacterized protein LOC110446587 [Mizuhopecten yessoensis]